MDVEEDFRCWLYYLFSIVTSPYGLGADSMERLRGVGSSGTGVSHRGYSQSSRRMIPRILRLFTTQMTRTLPEYTPLIQLILQCNLRQRKCILSLSRIQAIPFFPRDHSSPISYAYRQLSEDLESLVTFDGASRSLHYCLNTFSPLFSTPISAGLINMLVRNLPLPDENEYRSEILSGIRKEINAAVNKYHPASFNWDAILFFAVPSRYLPSAVFHPNYPFIGRRTPASPVASLGL